MTDPRIAALAEALSTVFVGGGTRYFQQQAAAILAALPPDYWCDHDASLTSALAEGDQSPNRCDHEARFADWLVTELAYPYDVEFSVPPPLSLREMAEAWHRHDPEESVEDHLLAMTDPTFGAPPEGL